MSAFRTLSDMQPRGKRALVRVDLNVSVLGLLAAIFVCTSAVTAAQPQYRVAQTISLASGQKLNVQVDARLSDEIIGKMWDGCADPGLMFYDEPLAEKLTNPPLLPAKLTLDHDAKVVSTYVFWKQAPIARIEPQQYLVNGKTTYLVTGDDDACFGSYSGKVTLLFQPTATGLGEVFAVNESGRTDEVVLSRALKSGWRIIADGSLVTKIEKVSSHPDFDRAEANLDRIKDKSEPMPFLITYTTFSPEVPKWTSAKSRSESGIWEDEGDNSFPPAEKFP